MTELVSANTSTNACADKHKRPINETLSGKELSFIELILNWDDTSILMDIAGERFIAQLHFSLNNCIDIYRHSGDVKFIYEQLKV